MTSYTEAEEAYFMFNVIKNVWPLAVGLAAIVAVLASSIFRKTA